MPIALTHRLLIPPQWGEEKHWCVNCDIAKLCEWLQEAIKEAQAQSTFEAERQKQYYDWKDNAISLEKGDLVLAKTDAYRGKRRVKDQWEEEPYEMEHQVAEGDPLYLMKNHWAGCSWFLHWNWLFLTVPAKRTPLCMVVQAKQAQCTPTTLEEQP